MNIAWIDFAITGDRGWPAYDARLRATKRFDETLQLVHDPRPDPSAAGGNRR
ncbi:hypothetical protein [Streptomyces sp. SA15]|uniref:hypothetical protein n=1 Tax=Streptomyces sp. SA15 TaxID=934019 RepID=UPI0015C7D9D9|nr:hypothetical protein [Streptomyces sp. SA15]